MADAALTHRLRETLDSLWSRLRGQATAAAERRLLSAEVFLNTTEGPIRVALDEHGLRHLLVPVSPETPAVDDRSGSGVWLLCRDLVLKGKTERFLDVMCRRMDLQDVFAGLAADICTRIASAPDEPAVAVIRSLDEWRSLLGIDRPKWTVATIAGLCGELITLHSVLQRDASAADLWTGAYGDAHDFNSPHHAIEVKTTIRPTGRLVRIHGTDQLEAPASGLLYLTWLRLVESSGGATVEELIGMCLNRAAQPHLVAQALDRIHLPPRDDHLFSGLRLELVEQRWFSIDAAFPRLTADSFRAGAVPLGVAGIEYTVDLDTAPAWTNDGADAILLLVQDR